MSDSNKNKKNCPCTCHSYVLVETPPPVLPHPVYKKLWYSINDYFEEESSSVELKKDPILYKKIDDALKELFNKFYVPTEILSDKDWCTLPRGFPHSSCTEHKAKTQS